MDLLNSILQVSQCTKGMLACKDTVRDDILKVVALVDATPLAFPDARFGETVTWPPPDDIPHDRFHSLLHIPLFFSGKLCGYLCLSNTTSQSNNTIQSLLEPLVPVGLSYIIGTSLLSTEASKTQSFFLATMSHEIRTPLCGVIGMSRLLQGATNLSIQQKEYVDIIYRCGFQLLEIINDILDYAKMDSGTFHLESVAFSIRETVEDALEVVVVKAHEKHLQLSHQIDTQVPHLISGDRKRFRQIIINLLSNAIKFTPAGQVTLKMFMSPNQDRLITQVQDTGIGIEEKDQEKLFHSFVQIKHSPLDTSEGTGLGLAICKRLTELMKGDIRVKYSKKNTGTCMEFQIPLTQETTQIGEQALKICQNKSVLVVDTDSVRRLKLCQILIKLQFHVSSASTEEEGKLMLSSSVLASRFHVILIPSTIQSTFVSHKNIVLIDKIPINDISVANAVMPYLSPLSDKTGDSSTTKRLEDNTTTLQPFLPPPTLNILVVEDNECNMRVAVETLRRLGYDDTHIKKASNGLLALQLCQQSPVPFDVILMDLQMPIMDGFKATKLILQHYTTSTTPLKAPSIIAMTAFVLGTEREQCRQSGMKGFLPKPLLLQDLQIMLDIVQKRKEIRNA